jgi:S1-C subfamily serine protease
MKCTARYCQYIATKGDASPPDGSCRNMSEDAAEVEPLDAYSRAVVRERDLLVAIKDKPVSSVDDSRHTLGEWPLDRTMALVLTQEKEKLEIEVLPTEAAP